MKEEVSFTHDELCMMIAFIAMQDPEEEWLPMAMKDLIVRCRAMSIRAKIGKMIGG